MIKSANVDFYYSIGSRYSYLASTQIDALKTATGCHVEWHPINSARLISQREHNPFASKPSGQYEWNYRELDAQRWAKLYGVPYLEPRGRVQFDSELLARSCVVAKQFGKVAEYSHLLFAAMFQNSLTQIDERECIDRAEICGISTKDFQIALKAQETTNQLDEAIDRAINAGVFGVPTFIVNGELFWGNDRLILLRNYLYNDFNSSSCFSPLLNF
ncbi:DsbA family protein [Chamaesiphon sp. GL140_3_metabinner_50]|uniref:2-hydroxychromene-2-carboxylate isomerase n=1 Tax=Chamaesiphon sp. GL140_3_metabinner_50 TaxID=2970812 RepID=UPI0025CF8AEA|nr:DsbA family protein [Chamaesiphon sp. GL140_3_metabinner_50]